MDDEEKQAVEEVLSGPILVHGPRSELFEEAFSQFTRAPYAISVSSCTAGMHLIYHALGFGPGDEVIIPSQTHVATAHAVELTGARPVFIDVNICSGNIDTNAIEENITPRTKALAVVHYLGVPAEMEKISIIAKKHGLFLLEDCVYLFLNLSFHFVIHLLLEIYSIFLPITLPYILWQHQIGTNLL